MANFRQQMDIAERTLEMMAKTIGSLEQSMEEWKQTLEAAKHAGMMEELEKDVKEALQLSYIAVEACAKAIKHIDGKEIYSMMKSISTATGNVVPIPNGDFRYIAYERGKDELKKLIKRPAGGYGKFNDFNVQIMMLNDLIDITESIQNNINIISLKYNEYKFTLEQDDFMVQFVNDLDQNCFRPRQGDFLSLKTKIEETKNTLLNIELRIQSACTY